MDSVKLPNIVIVVASIAIGLCLVAGVVCLSIVIIRDGNSPLVSQAMDLMAKLLYGCFLTLGASLGVTRFIDAKFGLPIEQPVPQAVAQAAPQLAATYVANAQAAAAASAAPAASVYLPSSSSYSPVTGALPSGLDIGNAGDTGAGSGAQAATA